jgi:hypothetical protein
LCPLKGLKPVITYPEIFVNRNEFAKNNDLKTIIQIEVRDGKKMEILKILLGKEGFDKLNLKK